MDIINLGPQRPASGSEFVSKNIGMRQKRHTTFSSLSGSTVCTMVKGSRIWFRKSSTLSTDQVTEQHGSNRKSKTDIIHEIVRKWQCSLRKQDSESDPSRFAATSRHTTNDTITRTPAGVPQQTTNPASLIKIAILNSPSKALSARAICKKLKDTNEWYRTNREDGWQEAVARELAHNPAFEAVIECRKGKISKKGGVKWRIATVGSEVSSGGLSWRPPRHHPPSYRVELPVENVLEETNLLPAAEKQPAHSPPSAPMPLTPLHSHSPAPALGLQRITTFAGSSDRAKDERFEMRDSATRPENKCSITCNGSGSVGQTASPVGPPGNSNLSQSSSPTSLGGSEPHQQAQPGGTGDGSGGRKRPRCDPSDRTVDKPRLACVYRKRDPQTYGLHDPDYRACALDGWKNPADLLVHLVRKHGQHSCRRCYLYYSTAEECRAHSSECSGHLPSTREEKWERLWQIRFPGIPVPNDPYFEPPYGLSQPTIDPETEPTPAVTRTNEDRLPPSPQPQVPIVTLDTPVPGAQLLSPRPHNGDNQTIITSAAMQDMKSRIGNLEQKVHVFEKDLRLLQSFISASYHPSGTLDAAFGNTIYAANASSMLSVPLPFDDTVPFSIHSPSTVPSTGCHPSEFSAPGASSANVTTQSSHAPPNKDNIGVSLSEMELQSSLLDDTDGNYHDRELNDSDSPMPDMDHEAYISDLGTLSGSVPGFASNNF
ncbi:hypothetical protein BJX63DRAFT_80328 [Aspergillus granulosus]|uniref:Fork-head domain-containing protein n=1 Tax=Aspergillus granulosus TaxID=176169 RepID=A0ABR4GVQ8_9EURO